MSNNSLNLNQIISIFQDLALRQKMVQDFGYGPAYNIGSSRQMKFPYIWIENNTFSLIKSINGLKEEQFTFTIYCMDKINMGDDNYDYIISNTHYILSTMIQELAQHKYFIDFNLSIANDIIFTPIVEAFDDNVNGFSIDLTIKHPIRYTPCNSPIEPITGWTTKLDDFITVYKSPVKYYGSFFDTTTQTNLGATHSNLIKYNTTDISFGVTIQNQTQITIQNPGVYNIQFSAQFDKTDSGTDEVEIWLKKNGQNVAHSTSAVYLDGNNAKMVAAWNFFVQTTAKNEYFELAWWSPDTDIRILARGTQSNPTRPEIPSVILTVNKVD